MWRNRPVLEPIENGPKAGRGYRIPFRLFLISFCQLSTTYCIFTFLFLFFVFLFDVPQSRLSLTTYIHDFSFNILKHSLNSLLVFSTRVWFIFLFRLFSLRSFSVDFSLLEFPHPRKHPWEIYESFIACKTSLRFITSLQKDLFQSFVQRANSSPEPHQRFHFYLLPCRISEKTAHSRPNRSLRPSFALFYCVPFFRTCRFLLLLEWIGHTYTNHKAPFIYTIFITSVFISFSEMVETMKPAVHKIVAGCYTSQRSISTFTYYVKLFVYRFLQIVCYYVVLFTGNKCNFFLIME